MPADTALLDDLAALVDGRARPATDGDHVGGVLPRLVAAPGSTGQASALLTACAAEGLSVVFRGQGTALHWGAPPARVDVVVDTARLDEVLEHVAGDLVAVVQAGLTLDGLDRRVRAHGQQLALDQPRPGASVGGTLATARSGARRLQYGAPRDLVLGVTMVRADGVVAHAGGKVVKNVAGYDLAKLLTGSYGTLGMITEAVLRLHPTPAAARWLAVTCADGDLAAERAHRVSLSQLAPTAVEVQRDPGRREVELLVLLEGSARGVEERLPQLRAVLGDGAHEVRRDADQVAALPGAADDVLVRTAVPLTGVGRLLAAVATGEARHGVPLEVRGSAGVGVLHVSAPRGADVEALAGVVRDLRAACAGGSAVLLHGPVPLRAAVDAWGPVGGLDLMRRVKHEFDPDGRLAPGRFVGGI